MEITRIANQIRRLIDLFGYMGAIEIVDGKLQLTILGSTINGHVRPEDMVDIRTSTHNFLKLQLELNPGTQIEVKWTKDGEFEPVHPFGWIREDVV